MCTGHFPFEFRQQSIALSFLSQLVRAQCRILAFHWCHLHPSCACNPITAQQTIYCYAHSLQLINVYLLLSIILLFELFYPTVCMSFSCSFPVSDLGKGLLVLILTGFPSIYPISISLFVNSWTAGIHIVLPTSPYISYKAILFYCRYLVLQAYVGKTMDG